MNLLRTIKLKLDVNPNNLLPTMDLYGSVINDICKDGYSNLVYGRIPIHHKLYYELRNRYKELPSQLIISSIAKASEMLKPTVRNNKKTNNFIKKNGPLKTKKQKKDYPIFKCPQTRLPSIRYDSRSFNIKFNKKVVSLATINGRVHCGFNIPEYFEQYLSWKRKSAELFIRNNCVFLNIVMERQIGDSNNFDNETVGIDRGIKKIAVCSDNKFYGTKYLKTIYKYRRLKSNLQKCGSRSAKRHLKKISKKENRFRRNTNHIIAKKIINSISPHSTIVLEDLSKIRKNPKANKALRRELNNWGFYQFEQFLIYKGLSKYIKVEYVDARYTSQKCSKCSHTSKSNRRSQSNFICGKCGFQLNADLNASRNIKNNYLSAIRTNDLRAVVNQPNGSNDLPRQ